MGVLPCLPCHMKYSPMAQPEYGATYCIGAGSLLEALTTMV
ncbi:MAG: hypothetical protein KatS3mg103_0987 [Phycisphaerales bacterium]|nr:MAG: hypothetical protein KatS3mg103_0987 [Phycisphaerales bacterium]